MKLLLKLIILSSLISCGSKKPLLDNAVHLYEGQLKFIDGAYNNTAVNTFEIVNLLEELGINYNSQVDLVNLRFFSDKELEVSYYDNNQFETRILKGKHKNGGFRFKRKSNWFGIPLLLYSSKTKLSYLYLNNDEGILIELTEKSQSQVFFDGQSTKTVSSFHFDKAL